MTFTLLRRGQLIAVPPPEEALRFLEADDRSAAGPRSERRAVSARRRRGAELEDVFRFLGR